MKMWGFEVFEKKIVYIKEIRRILEMFCRNCGVFDSKKNLVEFF